MTYVKAYNEQPNGNGVYIKDFEGTLRVIIVYCDGFKADYPIEYTVGGKVAYDEPFMHSVTTKLLVKRAFRYIRSHTKKETLTCK